MSAAVESLPTIPLSVALKNGDTISYNHELGANPPKPIPATAMQAEVEKWFSESEGFEIFPTPDEDMARVHALLGHDKIPQYWVKTRLLHCPGCGRQNNFLDVVMTALNVHSAEFLRTVFQGQFGHVLNSASHQRCECADCGLQLPREASKFLCVKPADELSGEGGSNYLWNVYTHSI